MMDRVVSSPFNYSYPNSVLELATRVLTLTPFIKQFVDEKEPVCGAWTFGILAWVYLGVMTLKGFIVFRGNVFSVITCLFS